MSIFELNLGNLGSLRLYSHFIMFGKDSHKQMYRTIGLPVADLGGCPQHAPPYSPKFSQFHAVFQKIWQNHMLAAPQGSAPPPTGNPGSAPDYVLAINE